MASMRLGGAKDIQSIKSKISMVNFTFRAYSLSPTATGGNVQGLCQTVEVGVWDILFVCSHKADTIFNYF